MGYQVSVGVFLVLCLNFAFMAGDAGELVGGVELHTMTVKTGGLAHCGLFLLVML